MLYEKYRPKTFEGVLGQAKAIKQISRLQSRGIAGRAYWISGQSGTGKTTIAKLLAAEVADDFFVDELDAGQLTPARLSEIEKTSNIKGWGKGGRAVIINEAHGLRKPAIRQLLVMLERIPRHVIWIFTTTIEGQDNLFEESEDSHPLLSRCIEIALARRGLADPFATRAKEIAQAEGLDGQPLQKYKRLLQDCRNNMRQALQQIEAGVMCD
jgi:DNA polymerase-3 subunit gamma/tau